MTDPTRPPDSRRRPDDRPNVGRAAMEVEIQALQGEELPVDQDTTLDPDQIEDERVPTLTEWDRGRTDVENARAGETDDPIAATEDGLAWIPPTDPPVVPADDPDGVVVAAGTGPSAVDEPYDDSHRDGELHAEPVLTARVRDALRADAATSDLADRLTIAVVGATAVIRGPVTGLDDGDTIAEVAARVDGVGDVRDETEVVGLG